jgi:hypothetical protein
MPEWTTTTLAIIGAFCVGSMLGVLGLAIFFVADDGRD